MDKLIKDINEKIYHITTAIHNSRYSLRMLACNIKLNNPIWISEENELLISNTILEIVVNDKLNILAYNICGDHIHIIIKCNKKELSKIVGKIKAITAKNYNVANQITKICDESLNSKNNKTYNSLWTQKFGKNEITSRKQLSIAIKYVNNNREKHTLPVNKELNKIIEKIISVI
jgi:REP element-mobilizing transposase RayT